VGAEVIVVAKRSSYEQHVEDRGDPDVLRLLKARDPVVSRWKRAHDAHHKTLRAVDRALSRLGIGYLMLLGPRARFSATGVRFVMTVGGDGTLLAVSHNLGEVPILGVNSSPNHSVGFFCAAQAKNLEAMVSRALEGTLPSVKLARMQVSVGDRVCSRRVLNEALFCHAIPAATSRYIVEHHGLSEEQRSSGVWVGTAAGSTGAIRSAGGKVLPFSSRKLQLVTREPYTAFEEAYSLGKVIIAPEEEIRIRSKMQDARLFLDGPFAQERVRLGDVVTFSQSSEPLRLLGLRARREVVTLD
jgi:NAD+ kinase